MFWFQAVIFIVLFLQHCASGHGAGEGVDTTENEEVNSEPTPQNNEQGGGSAQSLQYQDSWAAIAFSHPCAPANSHDSSPVCGSFLVEAQLDQFNVPLATLSRLKLSAHLRSQLCALCS